MLFSDLIGYTESTVGRSVPPFPLTWVGCGAYTHAMNKNRVLALIDAENLCGTGRPTVAQVRAVRDRLRRYPWATPTMLCVCGSSSPANLVTFHQAAPQWRHVHKRGKDGADFALIEAVLDEVNLPARFSTVIIGSGDHAFAGVASYLKRLGLRVFVVHRSGTLSTDLYHQADATFALGVSAWEGKTSPEFTASLRQEEMRVG